MVRRTNSSSPPSPRTSENSRSYAREASDRRPQHELSHQIAALRRRDGRAPERNCIARRQRASKSAIAADFFNNIRPSCRRSTQERLHYSKRPLCRSQINLIARAAKFRFLLGLAKVRIGKGTCRVAAVYPTSARSLYKILAPVSPLIQANLKEY